MAAVRAIVALPEAPIKGSRQKKTVWHGQIKKEFDRLRPTMSREYPELTETKAIETWAARSGRGIVEHGQKALALCRKFNGHLRIVDNQQMTGNPSQDVRMACAQGLYNKIIRVSHFYDVMRNPEYNIGKPFPFPKTFEWLAEKTTELNPTDAFDDVENSTPIRVEPQVSPSVREETVDEAVSDASGLVVGNEASSASEQNAVGGRPIGVKAAKFLKLQQYEATKDDKSLTSAIEGWTNGFAQASMATVELEKLRMREQREQFNIEMRWKRSNDEMVLLQMLYKEDDADSVEARGILKRRKLRQMRAEEEQFERQRDQIEEGGKQTEDDE